MNRNAWIGIALAALVLLGGLAWTLAPAKKRENPQFARIDSVRAQVLEQTGSEQAEGKLEQASPLHQQYEEELAKLPDEMRQEYLESREEEIELKALEDQEKFMDEFYAMTPEEQRATIEKMVDQIALAAERGATDRGSSRPGGGNRFWMQQQQRPTSFGKDESGRNRDVERNKRAIDRQSPRTRARMDEFSRMMSDRMRQRGVQISGM